jgi:hypothetical protein
MQAYEILPLKKADSLTDSCSFLPEPVKKRTNLKLEQISEQKSYIFSQQNENWNVLNEKNLLDENHFLANADSKNFHISIKMFFEIF